MNMSENIIMTLIPALSALLTVWIQTGRKKDVEDINSKMSNIKCVVDEITEIGKKNNADISKLGDGIVIIERYRLEADLKTALARGYTTDEEARRLAELYQSYCGFNGNGYITPMYKRYLKLQVKG